MRYSRLFLMPLACLGLMAALVAFSPRAVDYGVVSVASVHDVLDISVPVDFIDRVAILEEAAAVGIPADTHRVAYTIANQPGATWRLAVDAYRHIDPGRLLV